MALHMTAMQARLAAAAAASLAAIASCSPPPPSTLSTTDLITPRVDTAAWMSAILDSAWSGAAAAEEAWPGFALRGQTLIIQRPQGPVALVTESAVPAGFERTSLRSPVYLRLGPPPDSLTGLRTGLAWAGRPAAATIVAFSGAMTLKSMIHEAFHTFQATRRSSREFAGGGGDLDLLGVTAERVKLINLEAFELARGLHAIDNATRRDAAVNLLSLRHQRCAVPGAASVCLRERVLEHREGSADYVSARTRASIEGRPRSEVPSALLANLDRLRNVTDLRRFHYYDRGHAMLRLIDMLAEPGWEQQAAKLAPDSLLSLLVQFDGAASNAVAQRLLMSTAARVAGSNATRVWKAWTASQDSIVRVFRKQPGIPVRVYPSEFPSRATGDPNSTSATIVEGADTATYTVGLKESRMWYGGDANFTVHRTSVRSTCCARYTVMAKAVVAGQFASVGDQSVPLDRPGASATGPLTLKLPTIEVHARMATVFVYSDSVTIRIP